MEATMKTPEMTEYEFENWFENTDLGSLEDVRSHVKDYAKENAFCDCEEEEGGNSVWAIVKATVEEYVDQAGTPDRPGPHDSMWDYCRPDGLR
jgi:hypothetical protein